MSLQTRLAALITAVGADIKAHTTRLTTLESQLSGLQPPAIEAQAFHNTNQSVAKDATVALALNSERADSNAIHDPATNNSRLTCKTVGTYVIVGSIYWNNDNNNGTRGVRIRLNGTTYLAVDDIATIVTIGSGTGQNIAAIADLVPGDYIELVVTQGSTTAVQVLAAAQYSAELRMVRVPGAQGAAFDSAIGVATAYKWAEHSGGGIPLPNTQAYVGWNGPAISITAGATDEMWLFHAVCLARSDSANETDVRARIRETVLNAEIGVSWAQRLYWGSNPNLAGFTTHSIQCRYQVPAGVTRNFVIEQAVQNGSYGGVGYDGGTSHNNMSAIRVV